MDAGKMEIATQLSIVYALFRKIGTYNNSVLEELLTNLPREKAGIHDALSTREWNPQLITVQDKIFTKAQELSNYGR